MLTFVCDQCGASGATSAPGTARCLACGYVGLVEAPADWRPGPDPDPFAPPAADHRAFASRDDGETVAPTGRFATLWVRPGAREAPTPELGALRVARPRSLRRPAIAAAMLAGGAALAWVAAVAIVPRWTGGRGAPLADVAPPPAPAPRPEIASAVSPPAHEQSAPAPAPAPRAAPARRAPPAASGLAAGVRAVLANPVPTDRRCVPNALRARRDLADRMPSEIAVRLRVAATGDVGRIEVLDVPDRDVADAIGEAVRTCRFSPGTDEEGRPIALPVLMRIRFASAATQGF